MFIDDFEKALLKYPDHTGNLKMFQALMADLFPHEKKWTNLIVSLYKLQIVERIQKENELNNAAFFAMKKTLIENYATSDVDASEAVRIWFEVYGKRILKKPCSFVMDQIPEISLPDELGINKVKSFGDCVFKFNIPKVTRLDDYIEISSSLTFRVSDPSVELALYKGIFVDRIGNRFFDQYIDKLLSRGSGPSVRRISCNIPLNGKHPGMQRARIFLQILSTEGAIYQLEYMIDDTRQIKFEGVSKAKLKEEMQEDFKAIIENSYRTTSSNSEVDAAGRIGVSPTGEFIQVPEIEEFRKALLREKFFLQKDGGRKYKVTDGKQLNIQRGLATYVFDMESELFLADDAPITLRVGTNEATGSVLVCEGFSITVVIDKDFGDKINSATISVEPWKLLEVQVNKLNSITSEDKLAIKIMRQGPGLVTKDPIHAILKGQDAVKKKVSESDITVVWGPPGTGKSYTMANIAIDFLSHGKSVLMVSHSNISVDGVVNQVITQLKAQRKDVWLKSGRILRYGYVRDEKLAENRNAVAFNYALDKNPDLRNRMDILQEKKKSIKKIAFYSKELDAIEKELKSLRGKIRSQEAKYVACADMVATTISKATIDHLFDEKRYDLVMFDEASMAYVTQIFCAAKLAKEKFICVGDFNQLAPIAQSEAQKILQIDIFSYLGIVDTNGVLHNHKWLVMLNEQRRMLPAISAFPNKYVYNNLLKDHPSVSSKQSIAAKAPVPNEAMMLVDLAGTYCATDKNLDNSRYNIINAIIAFALAKQTNTGHSKEEIGIITPYAAQARLIGAMVLDELGSNAGQIACSTVHQFQGSERDAIIFDSVESFPGTQAGFLMSKNENRSLVRLINVAMTRARGKLIVQGNSQFWLNAMKGKNNFFLRLMEYMQENSFNIRHAENKSLEQMLLKLDFGKNIRYFDEANLACKMLNSDIEKAKNKIIISLPSSEMNIEFNKQIYDALLQARRNCVSVYVKAIDYESLPADWKKISCASKNATFPLIVIDDSVVWYGLPLAKGRFKGKDNMSFVTVLQLFFRLSGKHTVDMIRSLTDIDMKVINAIRKPLTGGQIGHQENDNNTELGNKLSGIHAYVNKYVRCQVCNKPMTVVRSYKGKIYLKCSSGDNDHNAFLTKDIVNSYISHTNPTCPQCRSYIEKCGVSKLGLWVRCDNGHYPKVDEI
ncbi:MAG: AAA domain-containing protein [Lachnospiraceae bacterium]